MDFYQPKILASERDSSPIDIWVNYIKNRITKQNKNYIIVICGETGSGKSWLALKIMELLDNDPQFRKVFFNGIDFLNYCESDSKEGDCIIWDEAGITKGGMNRREWHNNNEVVSAFQVMRYLNFVMILTVPSLSYIDSGIINLIHMYLEVKRVDKDKELCYVIPKQLQHNPLLNKTYKKSPRLRVNNKIYKLKQFVLKKPSDALTIPYEKKQREFKNAELKSYKADMIKDKENKEKDWSKPTDTKDIVTKVLENHKHYTTNRGVSWELIAHDYDLGQGTAAKVKKVVERQLKENKPI